MRVIPDLKRVMKAHKCGCGMVQQNDSGMVLAIAIILGATVLISAVCGHMLTKPSAAHMKAVQSDLDRIEAAYAK